MGMGSDPPIPRSGIHWGWPDSGWGGNTMIGDEVGFTQIQLKLLRANCCFLGPGVCNQLTEHILLDEYAAARWYNVDGGN